MNVSAERAPLRVSNGDGKSFQGKEKVNGI